MLVASGVCFVMCFVCCDLFDLVCVWDTSLGNFVRNPLAQFFASPRDFKTPAAMGRSKCWSNGSGTEADELGASVFDPTFQDILEKGGWNYPSTDLKIKIITFKIKQS